MTNEQKTFDLDGAAKPILKLPEIHKKKNMMILDDQMITPELKNSTTPTRNLKSLFRDEMKNEIR